MLNILKAYNKVLSIQHVPATRCDQGSLYSIENSMRNTILFLKTDWIACLFTNSLH